MNEKFTIGLLVNNHFGVLNRITGLYAKRGYNIDSLTVGVTENKEYSRMTIVSSGDEDMSEQVVRQLQKLHDVKMVTLLPDDSSVSAEHMLIKLKLDEGSKAKISEFIDFYGGRTVDFGDGFITAKITASTNKIDELIENAAVFGIIEVCRSGVISLCNGTQNVLSANV